HTRSYGDLSSDVCSSDLAAAYKGMVEQFRDVWKMSTAEALAKTEEASDGYLASILSGPADQVSWHGLEHLTRKDPDAAIRRWERSEERRVGTGVPARTRL